jgi:hypothetical protein
MASSATQRAGSNRHNLHTIAPLRRTPTMVSLCNKINKGNRRSSFRLKWNDPWKLIILKLTIRRLNRSALSALMNTRPNPYVVGTTSAASAVCLASAK